MTELEKIYTSIGGQFLTPANLLQKKMESAKAFVFDWDGVFNNGQKTGASGSSFSEIDSMGSNLLRFSHYLKHGQMPLTAVLSGEKNDTAFYFCEREGFNYSFFKVAHKKAALEFLCEKENITPSQVIYFYDDVLDLPIAEACGVRIMVNQKVNPLFADYCIKNHLVDYLTSASGGTFAVREATELLMALNQNYEQVITGRKNNSDQYKEYISQRRQISPEYYSLVNGHIVSSIKP